MLTDILLALATLVTLASSTPPMTAELVTTDGTPYVQFLSTNFNQPLCPTETIIYDNSTHRTMHFDLYVDGTFVKHAAIMYHVPGKRMWRISVDTNTVGYINGDVTIQCHLDDTWHRIDEW